MTRFTPSAETTRNFRNALGHFATGVTVVTCKSDNGPLGITVNSFASVSLDPPLILWSPARASRRFAAFEGAGHFAVHILGDHQHKTCEWFVRGGEDFSHVDWHEGEDGVPLIDGCLARFECARYAIHDGGDHAIIVGRVTAATVAEGTPLLFARGTYGHFTDLD